MTSTIIHPPSLFVDSEFIRIPYDIATLRLNRNIEVKRSTTPYSQMETGKFRRLFNRHTTAFRRW